MIKGIIFLFIIIGSWGYGYIIFVNLLKKHFTSSLVDIAYCIGIGLGTISHLLLILGSLFGVNLFSASVIVVAGFCLAIYQWYKLKSKAQAILHKVAVIRKITLVEWTLLFVITVNIIYSLLANALIPPISYDEVAYHLAIPKIFQNSGTISYIPFIPYSNWPMEGEMLFTLALLFSSEIMAHLTTWLCFIIICLLLIGIGNRWFSLRTGLVAAAIFSSTGMVTTLAGTALIELPLTLFAALAMFAFLEWVKTRLTNVLMLSAICAGLAASTKFNWALLPFFWECWFSLRSSQKRKISHWHLSGFLFLDASPLLLSAPGI